MDKMLAMDIDVPVRVMSNTHGVPRFETQYQHMTITDTTIISYTRGSDGSVRSGTRREVPNPIGKVYVVHVRNFPMGDSIYGADDLTEVEKLNLELAGATTSIGQVIKYHGDPVTLVFGARASNLKKGPNKIWGNLPKDGRVENLELASDLTASNAHKNDLKEDLHALMGVPEIAQGTKQAISNTSGVALHTMYLPLIERATMKQRLYGPKLVDVLILVLRWYQQLGLMFQYDDEGKRTAVDKRKAGTKLTEDDYQNIKDSFVLHFELPLPKDRLMEVQIQQTRVEAGLQDRESALIALGEDNPKAKLKKIVADQKARVEENPIASKKDAGTDNPSIRSGFGAGDGENDDEPDGPKGRPKTGGDDA
jgi:hypothetical protein